MYHMIARILMTILIPLVGIGAASADSVDVRLLQRNLNLLGFNTGLIDGRWGQNSQAALNNFLLSRGQDAENKSIADAALYINSIVLEVVGENAALRYTDIQKLRPAVIISERLDFLNYRYDLSPVLSNVLDWNNDGINDLLMVGSILPNNKNPNFVDTNDYCGVQQCAGYQYGPSLFIGGEDGNYRELVNAFEDQRVGAGQLVPKHIFVHDFNEDGIQDLYIADTGNLLSGYRDSYFLSDGLNHWVEASEIVLQDSARPLFSHATTIGDIDGDGDIDIVSGHTDGNLYCFFNIGSGKLFQKNCGRFLVNSIELGDIDGDGDLDLIYSGSGWGSKMPLGVALNDGFGNFTHRYALDEIVNYENSPAIFAVDLDLDGDLDLVVSRVGRLYAGFGIQIIENRGEGDFRGKFLELLTAPNDVAITSEGNSYNQYVSEMRFEDVDEDGYIDIILLGNPTGEFYGSFLKQSPGFEFTLSMESLTDLNLMIIKSEEVFEDPQAMMDRLRASSVSEVDQEQFNIFLSNYSQAIASNLMMSQFIPIAHVNLQKSGATVTGIKDVNVEEERITARLMISWSDLIFPVDICFEENPGGESLTKISITSPGIFSMDNRLRSEARERCGEFSGYFMYTRRNQRGIEIAYERGVEALFWDLRDRSIQIISALPLPIEERVEIIRRFE